MLEMDPKLATMAGAGDIIKLMFSFWSGLLPYMHFEREAFLLPYMTRDFIQMKTNERLEAKSFFERAYLTTWIYLGQFANMTFNPAIMHLRNRGIYTCYWVVNEPKELNHVLRATSIEGVMTDRPDDLQGYFMPQVLEQVARELMKQQREKSAANQPTKKTQ